MKKLQTKQQSNFKSQYLKTMSWQKFSVLYHQIFSLHSARLMLIRRTSMFKELHFFSLLLSIWDFISCSCPMETKIKSKRIIFCKNIRNSLHLKEAKGNSKVKSGQRQNFLNVNSKSWNYMHCKILIMQ